MHQAKPEAVPPFDVTVLLLQPPKRPSLWGLVKNMVGRDISAISLPVAFHEPLGLLQVRAFAPFFEPA
eukprot:SAG31_NODE_629_length_13436_cov_116.287825_11_plen_68_part_00